MLHWAPEDICTDTYWIEWYFRNGLVRDLTLPFEGSDMQYVSIIARLEKDCSISDGSKYTMIIMKVGVQAILGSKVFCTMTAPSVPKGNGKVQSTRQ